MPESSHLRVPSRDLYEALNAEYKASVASANAIEQAYKEALARGASKDELKHLQNLARHTKRCPKRVLSTIEIYDDMMQKKIRKASKRVASALLKRRENHPVRIRKRSCCDMIADILLSLTWKTEPKMKSDTVSNNGPQPSENVSERHTMKTSRVNLRHRRSSPVIEMADETIMPETISDLPEMVD